jgi:hypothetical protein
MKRLGPFIAALMAAAIATAVRSGHELPVYPSYYPHEIEIQVIAPERAAGLLIEGKIQAYVGSEPRFSGALPDFIRQVESLGSFVIVRVNPQSPLATDAQSACMIAKAVIRDMAGQGGKFIFHPYPVTPLHGDYLYHADLAAAAKARLLDGSNDIPLLSRNLRVKASGRVAQALIRPDWSVQEENWDAEIIEVSAADLVASSTVAVNGWEGPPWVRTGWFHAERLLADSVSDPAQKQRAESHLQRLTAGDFDDLAARINLERALVASLTFDCGKIVAGYTLKREYFSDEYSAGIENIGYDAISGLHSPVFLRTVKLKDFPWNGWLMLGTDAQPAAAWNPIAGMNDPFGRLMWFAVGDPALIPSPYEAGWMLNRIADVQSAPNR